MPIRFLNLRPLIYASTYFHRRVRHMIVFSRPPGWKRRAGDVWTSSSGGDARRWPRKDDPSGGLAGPYALVARPLWCPPSRRTTLLAEKPARPSDVSPFYVKVSTRFRLRSSSSRLHPLSCRRRWCRRAKGGRNGWPEDFPAAYNFPAPISNYRIGAAGWHAWPGGARGSLTAWGGVHYIKPPARSRPARCRGRWLFLGV